MGKANSFATVAFAVVAATGASGCAPHMAGFAERIGLTASPAQVAAEFGQCAAQVFVGQGGSIQAAGPNDFVLGDRQETQAYAVVNAGVMSGNFTMVKYPDGSRSFTNIVIPAAVTGRPAVTGAQAPERQVAAVAVGADGKTIGTLYATSGKVETTVYDRVQEQKVVYGGVAPVKKGKAAKAQNGRTVMQERITTIVGQTVNMGNQYAGNYFRGVNGTLTQMQATPNDPQQAMIVATHAAATGCANAALGTDIPGGPSGAKKASPLSRLGF